MYEAPQIQQIAFQSRIELLDSMIDWVRCNIENGSFTCSERYKIELAMEEALVNVIHHAYRGSKDLIEIIAYKYPNGRIEFKIIDKGLPFNPLLESRKVNIHAPIDQRCEGGLGIFFIRQCMDEVHYERQHPFNILTLIKN